MAKLQYGPIVTSASGKVAGVVFSIWKGVQYAKRWVKPTYTNTAAQIAIRTAFATLCQEWKYLAEKVVLAWTNYAKGKGIANRNAYLGHNTIFERDSKCIQLAPHNAAWFPMQSPVFSAASSTCVKVVFTWPTGYTTGDKALLYTRVQSAKTAWNFYVANYPATCVKDNLRITGITLDMNAGLWATVAKQVSMFATAHQLTP